jgi:hypothetical protein
MDIITSRPEGMSFEDYKAIMATQKRVLDRKKKGSIVWLSKLYPSNKVLDMMEKSQLGAAASLLVTGQSFKGSAKELKVK